MPLKEKAQILFLDQSVDQVQTLCLVLPFFSDEKPLKGLNGMVDWRLNGQISRQLLANHIQGKAEETVLIPAPGRIPAKNIVMLGLGESKEINREIYQKCLARLQQVLNKAKVNDYVMVMQTLISPTDQALWIAEFLLQAKSPFFAIMAQNSSIAASLECMKSRFGEKINCRVEGPVVETPNQKPSAVR